MVPPCTISWTRTMILVNKCAMLLFLVATVTDVLVGIQLLVVAAASHSTSRQRNGLQRMREEVRECRRMLGLVRQTTQSDYSRSTESKKYSSSRLSPSTSTSLISSEDLALDFYGGRGMVEDDVGGPGIDGVEDSDDSQKEYNYVNLAGVFCTAWLSLQVAWSVTADAKPVFLDFFLGHGGYQYFIERATHAFHAEKNRNFFLNSGRDRVSDVPVVPGKQLKEDADSVSTTHKTSQATGPAWSPLYVTFERDDETIRSAQRDDGILASLWQREAAGTSLPRVVKKKLVLAGTNKNGRKRRGGESYYPTTLTRSIARNITNWLESSRNVGEKVLGRPTTDSLVVVVHGEPLLRDVDVPAHLGGETTSTSEKAAPKVHPLATMCRTIYAGGGHKKVDQDREKGIKGERTPGKGGGGTTTGFKLEDHNFRMSSVFLDANVPCEPDESESRGSVRDAKKESYCFEREWLVIQRECQPGLVFVNNVNLPQSPSGWLREHLLVREKWIEIFSDVMVDPDGGGAPSEELRPLYTHRKFALLAHPKLVEKAGVQDHGSTSLELEALEDYSLWSTNINKKVAEGDHSSPAGEQDDKNVNDEMKQQLQPSIARKAMSKPELITPGNLALLDTARSLTETARSQLHALLGWMVINTTGDENHKNEEAAGTATKITNAIFGVDGLHEGTTLNAGSMENFYTKFLGNCNALFLEDEGRRKKKANSLTEVLWRNRYAPTDVDTEVAVFQREVRGFAELVVP
ncbi:unnamed protein product, partial [Amoebophrya sp. A25]|eukprot:GSA25T00027803001.1